MEKEFEQLKQDYSDLNRKEKESIGNCRSLEEENQNLLRTIEQLDQEKQQLRQTIERINDENHQLRESQTKFTDEITQLNQLLEKSNLDALQTRINNYENAVSQYEEYRLKLETNLQKITQQRDTLKMDLRLTKEMLMKKETDYQQLEQRLDEVNRALTLADSHLQEEIEKIKINLEQEYNRRYERDQKQLLQLTNELEKQTTNNSASVQDIEEVKKMYRTEIDRLYRENIELSQNQAKLIDEQQKQLQIMKKDFEDNQKKIFDEFREQSKKNHLEEKFTFEQDHRNREENLQNRLEHLVQLLEQANETYERIIRIDQSHFVCFFSSRLNEERLEHSKQENEYQQTISSLQKKIADMIKQHTKAMDEIKRDLNQERLAAQKRQTSRPICVPEYVQVSELISSIIS